MNMKTMMKKGGIYAACAAVLVVMAAAAVVLSCPTPGSPGKVLAIVDEKGYQPPLGMGAVKLNLANTTRTVRSIVPGTTLASFDHFSVQFTAAGNGAQSDTSHTSVVYSALEGPYDLAPGIYDIEVIGYMTAAATGDAAAGSVTGVTVVANSVSNTATILLESYDPATAAATDTGTFTYTISNSVTGLTGATMKFTKITGAGSAPLDVDLMSGWNGSVLAFPAGYYYVDFILNVGSATRTFRHILHIYKNQTSSFSYTFDDSYFTFAKITLDVDFDPIVDPKPELEKSTNTGTTLTDGETVTLSFNAVGGNPELLNIVVTNDDDYDTIEWFLNKNGTTALTTTQGVSSDNKTLSINTANAPFNAQGLYQLTVVGITPSPGGGVDGVASSSYILIAIVP